MSFVTVLAHSARWEHSTHVIKAGPSGSSGPIHPWSGDSGQAELFFEAERSVIKPTYPDLNPVLGSESYPKLQSLTTFFLCPFLL